MYEEFQSYRFLWPDFAGIIITTNLEKVSVLEAQRPNLQKIYEAEIRKAFKKIEGDFF